MKKLFLFALTAGLLLLLAYFFGSSRESMHGFRQR